MYDTIIIGAGPAGISASIYLRRANKKVLILEALSYGGQIIGASKVENYPGVAHISGFDLATHMYNQTKELGTEIIFEKAVDIKNGDTKKVITEKNTYECKSVIIATGSSVKKLGLANEDNLAGKGISYCATCDGAFYKNKTVAVVGGGPTAISDAIYLSSIASKVYLIHRRSSFRDSSLLDRIKTCTNIELLMNSEIKKIHGMNKLDAVDISNNDTLKRIEVDGLFVAIGRIPENANFTRNINTDDSGYIDASEDCHTNIEGIFVAGDCRKKRLRQLVTATSDGAIAATEAIKYISKKDLK